MNRSPYNSYHGRKSLGRRVLTAVAVILAVILALALVALFVLPNYMTYTADGLQLNLPLPGRGGGSDAPNAQPQPSAAVEEEPEFIVETPSPAPSAQASAAADLSRFERREVPRGLVVAAGEGPGEGEGFLFDQRVPGSDSGGSVELNRSLLYAAAYVNPDWDSILEEDETARTTAFADTITAWCLSAAASGYDEVILSDAVTAENDPTGQAQAALYRRVRAELDEAGWQGRLGLVLDQTLAGPGYDADLLPAIAQSFDRLYFRRSLQSNVKSALDANGFSGAAADIVTVYATAPGGVTWSWAVLP